MISGHGHGEVNSVGVDIDSHDGLRFLISYLRACNVGVVRGYYTKHGFHLRIKIREGIDYHSALDIRRYLGDDPDRVSVDERRLVEDGDLRRWDTLFGVRVKNGKVYSRREINPLACGPYPESGGKAGQKDIKGEGFGFDAPFRIPEGYEGGGG